MSNNWVVENLANALRTWNEKLSEIWRLLTESPTAFKGGVVWDIIVTINGSLKAIGYALLVLFFLIGVIKQYNSMNEIKRPEQVFKLFLRFAIAKAIVTWGMDLMLKMFEITQGILSKVMQASGFSESTDLFLPQGIIDAVENCGFWESIPLWAVTLIGSLVIWVLSLIMIMTVYGRFFKLFMYIAISPIPLSTFAGEETSHYGKSFLRSFAGVCLEGVIVILACIIYSVFASSMPSVITGASAITIVWTYIGEIAFNMLVLTGTIKLSDQITRQMLGLN